MQALGYHTLIELYNCNSAKINDTKLVEQTLLEAAQIANLSVVNTTIHHFNPIGVSGVVVIKESHIAIHTWPEHNYVALDFFTCNESYELTEALAYIKRVFEASVLELKEIKRGQINAKKQKDFSEGKYIKWAKEIIYNEPIIESKIAKACGVDSQKSINYLIEALKYLDLVAYTKQTLTPSLLVDYAWHEFILCTRFYEKFCIEKFGKFIHHHPGGRTKETKNNFRKTIKYYIINIGEPQEEYWGEFAKEEWLASQCGSCVSNN